MPGLQGLIKASALRPRAPTLRATRHDAAACPGDLQNQASQLIERVSDLHAHQDERCDHEIETKMHEGFAPNISCGPRSSAEDRKPNSVLIGDDLL